MTRCKQRGCRLWWAAAAVLFTVALVEKAAWAADAVALLPTTRPAGIAAEALDNPQLAVTGFLGELTYKGRNPTTGTVETFRKTYIERDSSQQNKFYVEPTFALQESKRKLEGYPSAVHQVKTIAEGITILEFAAILKADGLEAGVKKQLVSDGVLTDDAKIVVSDWPVIHAYVVVKNSLTGEVYGRTSTGSLRNADQAKFTLPFTEDGKVEFLRAYAANEVDFVWSYRARTSQRATGSIESSAEQGVVSEALKSMSHEQLAGQAPITEVEKAKIATDISIHITTRLRASHPEMIPLLLSIVHQPSFVEQVFVQQQEPVDFDSLTPAQQEVIAAYFKPHLKTATSAEQKTDVETKTNEKGTTKTAAAASSVSVPVKMVKVGGSVSGTVTAYDLDRLEKSSGVTFQKANGSEEYLPHSIKVSRFNHAALTAKVNQVGQIQIEKPDYQYLLTTSIPGYFTSRLLAESTDVWGENERLRDEVKRLNGIIATGQDALTKMTKDRDHWKNTNDENQKAARSHIDALEQDVNLWKVRFQKKG